MWWLHLLFSYVLCSFSFPPIWLRLFSLLLSPEDCRFSGMCLFPIMKDRESDLTRNLPSSSFSGFNGTSSFVHTHTQLTKTIWASLSPHVAPFFVTKKTGVKQTFINSKLNHKVCCCLPAVIWVDLLDLVFFFLSLSITTFTGKEKKIVFCLPVNFLSSRIIKQARRITRLILNFWICETEVYQVKKVKSFYSMFMCTETCQQVLLGKIYVTSVFIILPGGRV